MKERMLDIKETIDRGNEILESESHTKQYRDEIIFSKIIFEVIYEKGKRRFISVEDFVGMMNIFNKRTKQLTELEMN